MFSFLLAKRSGTWDVTQLLTTCSWSGDKSSIVRKLTATLAHLPDSGLPAAELGDAVALANPDTLFAGYVVRRSVDSEANTMSIVCHDRGIYLCNNDGTYKFRGVAPETIVRTVCEDKGIPTAELAATGVAISRKFSAVALDKIVTTAYTLAAELTGERYAVRMMPDGLQVKIKSQSRSSLILRPKSNLMRATTVESIENMCNSVGIYDEQGSLLRELTDQDAANLYGLMQQHITQKDGEDATDEAQALLDDGSVSKTVSVEVLGDSSLITGETVIAQEDATGLSGLFWIEADTHTWQRGQYKTKLTLNCRNVMTKTTAGSELT